MQRSRIKCNDVSYRQGFIEVATGIHPKHVKIEAWNVSGELDISRMSAMARLGDGDVVGNTEIELSLVEAKALINLLSDAVHKAETTVS